MTWAYFVDISYMLAYFITFRTGRVLQWCHNGRDGISNHQRHNCLLNRLFGGRSKKTSKFRVTSLCVGDSPVTGEFPAHRASKRKMFPFDDVIMVSFPNYHLIITYHIISQTFQKFTQNTVVKLSCIVRNFRTIGPFKRRKWVH